MSLISKQVEGAKKESSEREKRLELFRRLKEGLAFITNKEEKTQQEFSKYINSLFDDEACRYKTGLKDIVSLCNNTLFNCEFRSKENFSYRGKLKFECQREKIMKLRRVL